MTSLSFNQGTLLLRGSVSTPYGKWDPRTQGYRIKAHHYPNVIDYLKESRIDFIDETKKLPPLETTKDRIKLRSYQDKALNQWMNAQKKGIIVLPTAAGKTYIALKAINKLNVQTLIVVPTLDLMDQWKNRIETYLNIEAGMVGGKERTIKSITVSTYASAYFLASFLGNQFMFLVFDEVHHLASPGYIQIAEMYIAPYRMGLTATFTRPDERHFLLFPLIGNVVFTKDVKNLTGDYLSPYEYKKMYVELTQDEKHEYEKNVTIFRKYLRNSGIVLRDVRSFQRFILQTGRNPAARQALLARNRAFKTALNAQNKKDVLKKILERNTNKKCLIFTLHNDLVYTISRRFFIPAITYKTPRLERQEILQRFRTGEYKAIVTSQVLDEGVDVPDASVGIILSGTGSKREYIQRLGRLLRKFEGKKAQLIEIVSKGTMEVGISYRRTNQRGRI